jgi:hypothetical protein
MLLIIFVIANHSRGVTSLILFVTINQLARLFAIIVSQLIRALGLLASHILVFHYHHTKLLRSKATEKLKKLVAFVIYFDRRGRRQKRDKLVWMASTRI